MCVRRDVLWSTFNKPPARGRLACSGFLLTSVSACGLARANLYLDTCQSCCSLVSYVFSSLLAVVVLLYGVLVLTGLQSRRFLV